MPPRRQQPEEEHDPILECYEAAAGPGDALEEVLKTHYGGLEAPEVFAAQELKLEALASLFRDCRALGLSLEETRLAHNIAARLINTPNEVDEEAVADELLEHATTVGLEASEALAEILQPLFSRRALWAAAQERDAEEDRCCKGDGRQVQPRPPLVPAVPPPLSAATLVRTRTELELLVEARVRELGRRKHIL